MTELRKDSPALIPQADGSLLAGTPVLLPFMAPRLQGDLHPDGKLVVALWGAGTLASVSLNLPEGPMALSPNMAKWQGGGLFVAQSQPVLLIEGIRLRSCRPARRSAWWSTPDSGIPVQREGRTRIIRTSAGVVIVVPHEDGLRVSAGEDEAEARAALALSPEDIRSEALAYVARCDEAPQAEPLVRSMIQQGLHAAFSAVRRDASGKFAGLAAGQGYSAPARTYYRDGYWTLQPLLKRDPEAVRDQIELLARGFQPDGEAPSAVILTGPVQAERWEVVRRNHKVIKEEHLRPGDWWSDHFDSPLFFILTIAEYVRATGDTTPLDRHWPMIETIYKRYKGFDSRGIGLPEKPAHHDRDWADNVYRFGYVSYDIGLWVGALDAIAEFAPGRNDALAKDAAETAQLVRANLDAELLTDAGYYADYGDKRSFREDHCTLDSLTLLRFNAVSPDAARRVLEATTGMLETSRNDTQPYGDWGVMCAWPPFARHADTREKSVFAYRYHNGSDWPYLTGLYGEQLARFGVGDPRAVLLRWWQTCLEEGWAGAVEFFSPPWGRGSLLQGWSTMPAHAWLEQGL